MVVGDRVGWAGGGMCVQGWCYCKVPREWWRKTGCYTNIIIISVDKVENLWHIQDNAPIPPTHPHQKMGQVCKHPHTPIHPPRTPPPPHHSHPLMWTSSPPPPATKSTNMQAVTCCTSCLSLRLVSWARCVAGAGSACSSIGLLSFISVSRPSDNRPSSDLGARPRPLPLIWLAMAAATRGFCRWMPLAERRPGVPCWRRFTSMPDASSCSTPSSFSRKSRFRGRPIFRRRRGRKSWGSVIRPGWHLCSLNSFDRKKPRPHLSHWNGYTQRGKH